MLTGNRISDKKIYKCGWAPSLWRSNAHPRSDFACAGQRRNAFELQTYHEAGEYQAQEGNNRRPAAAVLDARIGATASMKIRDATYPMDANHRPAALEPLAIRFGAKCAEKCGNVARIIARTVDKQGRRLAQRELCLLHTVEAEKKARAQGLMIRDSRRRA